MKIRHLLIIVAVLLLPLQVSAKEKQGKIYTDPTAGMEFVQVPEGCFQMGCSFRTGECGINERPRHEVCVNGFYMGKYEVTYGQWKKLMGTKLFRPSCPTFKSDSFEELRYDYPVAVSWDEAQDYIRKLNFQTGKNYRLPTEAEWEYACRSGGKDEKFCGGNEGEDFAWINHYRDQKVGGKSPNGLGIYDMSGNMYEWCSDFYQKDFYESSPKNNPTGPSSGSNHVLRGGSFDAPLGLLSFNDAPMTLQSVNDAPPMILQTVSYAFNENTNANVGAPVALRTFNAAPKTLRTFDAVPMAFRSFSRTFNSPDNCSVNVGFRLILPLGDTQ